jgi:hypothetical protein
MVLRVQLDCLTHESRLAKALQHSLFPHSLFAYSLLFGELTLLYSSLAFTKSFAANAALASAFNATACKRV